MMSAMAYPVSTTLAPQLSDRNRLTTAFRLILAIPHLILVGGVGAGFAFYNNGGRHASTLGGETGLLGGIAAIFAVISWFTIVLMAEHYRPIRDYTRFYLRWRVRAVAYFMLLADQYPPFGDAAYPAALVFDEPGEASRSPERRASGSFSRSRISSCCSSFFVRGGSPRCLRGSSS